MFKWSLYGLALAGVVLSFPVRAAGFADAVLAYAPGDGFATEFGSGLGYTDITAVLGEPSRVTPGQFGGPVDPFSPPYLREQLLSIGTGGTVTVRLDSPAADLSSNPFGIDFILFGSAGFVITNGDFSGGGVTDGSLFGANMGATRVSVSQDNETYYALDSSLARTVDGLAPTDGSGNFHLPLDPGLAGAAFAGLDLAGIRSIYAGSGGGTGYDISWARDEAGAKVSLDYIRYVRIDVLEGVAEIDAIATVPGGRSLAEDFRENPVASGWRSFGESSLFEWDSENKNLRAAWDSGKPNSYFYRPLNTVLTKDDDFSFGFDLRVDEIAVGLRPDRPFTFQLAVGLIHLAEATEPDFFRGTGTQSPNLVEFNYFPDSGFGATVSPVIVSGSNQFAPGFTFPLELTVGDEFRVNMRFDSATRSLTTEMRRNGEPFGPIEEVVLPSSFTDFKVDAFAVSSFNDFGADGSILARGVVDDIVLVLPDPPVESLSGALVQGEWRTEFMSRSGWLYSLERSVNVESWESVGESKPGTGELLELSDPAPSGPFGFYRVRATRL